MLSDGRFELGLGAGWMTTDYEQPASPSTGRASASTAWPRRSTVITGPVGRRPVSTSTGEHYRIAGLDGSPKPVQRPHPPIVDRRRRAARCWRWPPGEADIVGLNINLAGG